MSTVVTQAEIARELGISRSTVSRVLNGKLTKKFTTTPELQDAIRSVAHRRSYRPHAGAKAIAEGRFSAVSLLFRVHQNWLPPTLISGINDGLVQRGLHLNMAMLQLGSLTEDEMPKVLREQCVDGLLVHYADDVPVSLIDRIREHRVPAVWLNTRAEYDCVYPDEHGASLWATQQLLAAGHRQVSYIWFGRADRIREHYSSTDRRAGYVQAMREAGLAVDVHGINGELDIWGSHPTTPVLSYSIVMLKRPDRPTAIVCQERHEARAVMTAALSVGLRVPQDLTVVCFSEMVVDIGVSAATLAIPMRACGEVGVEMLSQKFDSPGEPLPAQSVPYQREFFGGEIVSPPSK